MARYPPTTNFFINLWCAGYEKFLAGIATAFCTRVRFCNTSLSQLTPILTIPRHGVVRAQIHVDKYKLKILSTTLAPYVTGDGSVTRFHACERRWRCDKVWADGVGCFEFAPELVDTSKKSTDGGSGGPKTDHDKGKGSVVWINFWERSSGWWQKYKAKFKQFPDDELPRSLV
jgi:hypothetical protein